MSESHNPALPAEHSTPLAVQESKSHHARPGRPGGWYPFCTLFERKKGKRNDQRKMISSWAGKIWFIARVWSVPFLRQTVRAEGEDTLRKHNPVQINRKESWLCQKWTYRWSRSVFLMKAWQVSNWSDQGFSWVAGFHGDPQSNQQCGDLPEWRVWTAWHVIMKVGQKGFIHLLSETESPPESLRWCFTQGPAGTVSEWSSGMLNYKLRVCRHIYWVSALSLLRYFTFNLQICFISILITYVTVDSITIIDMSVCLSVCMYVCNLF